MYKPGYIRKLGWALFGLLVSVLGWASIQPDPGRAQQQWGSYFLKFSNYTPDDPASCPNFSSYADNGCWSNYAKGWDKTGGPIDEMGNMTGGCNISDGNFEKVKWEKSIQGSLTGTYQIASGNMTIRIDTSDAGRAITTSGKTNVSKTDVHIEGNGVKSPPDPGEILQDVVKVVGSVNIKTTFTYSELSAPVVCQGKAKFVAYVAQQIQPYRLQLLQQWNSVGASPKPDELFRYEPAHFLIRLEKNEGGVYKPMKDQVVKIENPWSDLVVAFLAGFKASTCNNCDTVEYAGQSYYRTKGGPGEIELKTDPNGEAWITLFPNWGNLAKSGVLPTSKKPHTRTLKAAYYGSEKKPLVEAKVSVDLKPLAIVEAIEYTEAGVVLGGKQKPSIPLTAINQAALGMPGSDPNLVAQDRGTLIGATFFSMSESLIWRLFAEDRVRIFRDGASTITGTASGPPGVVLKPGDLLYADDEIFITACDLPRRPEVNSYPAEVSVQLRFFNGVRAKVKVSRDICSHRVQIGKITVNLPQSRDEKNLALLQGLVIGYGQGAVADALMSRMPEVVAKRLVPVYTAYDLVSSIGDYIAIGKVILNIEETEYVKLNSQVYLHTDDSGALLVSTLEGNPLVCTRKTNPDCVVVPAGQTATVPDSLEPALKKTDSRTASRASDLLGQLSTGDGVNRNGQVPIRKDQNFWTIGLVAFFVGTVFVGILALAGGTLLVFKRKNRNRQGMRAPVRSRPPITLNPGVSRTIHSNTLQNLASPTLHSPPRLEVTGGYASRSWVSVPPTGITIGRDPASGLAINDHVVSWRHARLDCREGLWVVTDLNSINGTYVNGVRIQSQALHTGDQIQVGECWLVFRG